MSSVIIRIALRYLAAALVARGLLPTEVSDMLTYDPDFSDILIAGAGVGIGALAEFWYYLARRFGWAK